jgi:hypothetical protein
MHRCRRVVRDDGDVARGLVARLRKLADRGAVEGDVRPRDLDECRGNGAHDERKEHRVALLPACVQVGHEARLVDAGREWVYKVEEERDDERDRVPGRDVLEPVRLVAVRERRDRARGCGPRRVLLLLVRPVVERVRAVRLSRGRPCARAKCGIGAVGAWPAAAGGAVAGQRERVGCGRAARGTEGPGQGWERRVETAVGGDGIARWWDRRGGERRGRRERRLEERARRARDRRAYGGQTGRGPDRRAGG